MPTITEFKNQLRMGGARSNQFVVELTFPGFVNAGQAARAASFLCKATSIPESTISDIPVMYRGRPVHLAGEREYAPWNITVINDGSYYVRNAFERWQQGIAQLDATNGLVNPADYYAQLTVKQLDRNDQVLKVYTFYDAYPTVVGQMGLSYDTPNIQEFEVSFVYNYYLTAA
jgi:hypothetical protein